MLFCGGVYHHMCMEKEGLLARARRVEIIEIPPRILFPTKIYIFSSVMSWRSTRDMRRAASRARPGVV